MDCVAARSGGIDMGALPVTRNTDGTTRPWDDRRPARRDQYSNAMVNQGEKRIRCVGGKAGGTASRLALFIGDNRPSTRWLLSPPRRTHTHSQRSTTCEGLLSGRIWRNHPV